jgi:hypothetical protein
MLEVRQVHALQLVSILGCLTIIPTASLYLYLNAKEQAFILIGTVEDRVRSVRVIVDNST